MYCYEYALINSVKSDSKELAGNYDYIHKGRLAFYIEQGTNEEVKARFSAALSDLNTPLAVIKDLADSYMPPVTTVCNIEFETKRKYYARYKNTIDNLEFKPRKDMPRELERLYKIMDNRGGVFERLND